MDRFIEVTLKKRGVSCVARMLDDLAPKTCEAVWNALPQEGDAFHAKYASNEVFALVPPFAPSESGMENPTITPITGDLLYFFFPPGAVNVPSMREVAYSTGLVDLAIFYGRDNLILSPNMGLVPGNRFGEVTENLDEMVEACTSVWREGFAGERLGFRRLE